jgi:hypothetical protein
MAQGEFDNLSCAGQPLNLDEYFSAPEELRAAYAVLKNANCAPQEVSLLSEISRLQRAIADTADVDAREGLQRELAKHQMPLSIILERRRRGTK